MKIDFTKEMENLQGTVIKQNDSEGKEKAVTLGDVCIGALLSNDSADRIDGKEKVKRYELARRINKRQKVNLEAEEVAKIKELIGKYQSPLIVGYTFRLLEGKTNG